MKVVHINKGDTGGGASVAVNRIHSALLRMGVHSTILVQEQRTETKGIFNVTPNNWESCRNFINFVGERLAILPHEGSSTMRFNFSTASMGRDLSTHPLVQEADIIHLHWINQGYVSMSGLSKLFDLGKPIVWTLHDMWPFTGGCHYAGTCLEFNEKCGFCPYLRNPKKTDLSALGFRAKRDLYRKANERKQMTIVSCSQWLNSMAQNSPLLGKARCLSIANPIDTGVYRPMDKNECRRRLGLPTDKKLLLFGAAKITDLRKGFRYLVEALRIIKDNFGGLAQGIDLVLFGKMTDEVYDMLSGYTVHPMGFVSSTKEIVDIYNAADTFVLPSLQDNLPNTVVESMACGTPVVGFRIGGVPEMVEHEQTGYLAEVKNSLSLALGIIHAMMSYNDSHRAQIAQRAQELFGETNIAKQYIDAYYEAQSKIIRQ